MDTRLSPTSTQVRRDKAQNDRRAGGLQEVDGFEASSDTWTDSPLSVSFNVGNESRIQVSSSPPSGTPKRLVFARSLPRRKTCMENWCASKVGSSFFPETANAIRVQRLGNFEVFAQNMIVRFEPKTCSSRASTRRAEMTTAILRRRAISAYAV